MARNLIFYCCLVAAVAIPAKAAPQDKLDNFNVDEILNNDRLLKSYIQCMLDADDGKCTNEGKEIKSRLPKLLATGCGDCSPSQLERIIKSLKHITEKHPAEWTKLKAKFDPTGEYTKKNADTWKQYGVTL
ncbi:ejaculatory bulb-specific protein 3-like [Schistocerca serialis cubense]|uniref:ejaculatory bulb-specific protein 3-like n=1 Tax=Schistocerca serialis cubense TaxID=2023355 RepID=UPI00214EFC0A|nr:ejaculatory bulb-specific protein 3-like [Schistocerca serialis cubense]